MPLCDLSILCVSKGEPHAPKFLGEMWALAGSLGAEFVLVADGEDARLALADGNPRVVQSRGYIESVLDEAVAFCNRDYILRLDDDERCSPGMVKWLERRCYETGNHWKFPREHLWGDERHVLKTAQLWPDFQTRLSVQRLSGGRYDVHIGSPFGAGIEAPVTIEHHKFLVKTLEQRRAITARYESIRSGAGLPAWSVPEEAYSETQLAAAIFKR